MLILTLENYYAADLVTTRQSDGEELLHVMYDHVLDEPVPERLKALLKP